MKKKILRISYQDMLDMIKAEVPFNDEFDYYISFKDGEYVVCDYRGPEMIVESFKNQSLALHWLENEDFEDHFNFSYANIVIVGLVYDGFVLNDGMAMMQFHDAETDELLLEIDYHEENYWKEA